MLSINISSDTGLILIAKAVGAEEKCRKVTYNFSIDLSYPNLSVGKRDILLAQRDACEKPLKNTRIDRLAIELEIMELDMALDLLP